MRIQGYIVSMSSWDLFDAQPREYCVLGVDRVGVSALGNILLCEYGFIVENVFKRVVALVR